MHFLQVVSLLIRLTFHGQSLIFTSILLLRSDFVHINYNNWESHGETYLTKCQAKGITPHPHVLAHSDKPSDKCTEQQSIEGFLKPVPKWSQKGLLEHLVEYIVTEDELIIQLARIYDFRLTFIFLAILYSREGFIPLPIQVSMPSHQRFRYSTSHQSS
jgi:hypothetical protein